ncbi:MAG TPA: AAA family ATPase [Rectinemataceae bacterium]|nr:AAA family ATPase [Rectinemataceae bacterium]
MEQRPDSGLVGEAFALTARARAEMAKRIVGKESLVRGLLMGIVAGGHVLLEGVPGLAKTLAVKTLAEISGLAFSRVQFTPDLLPADITGSLVYEQATGRFVPRRGPVFCNLLLADEVNRAPAKVQSALLEAMEERQVTIGEASLALPEPFFVLATQNPIEHEGTYPLPEAQLDRFLIKVLATYPSMEEESEIVKRIAAAPPERVDRVLGAEEIALMRRAAESVRVDEGLAAYAVRLVRSTRPTGPSARDAAPGREAASGGPGRWSPPKDLERDILRWVEYGASPRASIHLYRCARISALLDGRAYVLPDDIKSSAPEVLRHRLVLSYEAEAEGLSADDVIARVLSSLALP